MGISTPSCSLRIDRCGLGIGEPDYLRTKFVHYSIKFVSTLVSQYRIVRGVGEWDRPSLGKSHRIMFLVQSRAPSKTRISELFQNLSLL